ncbi:islet cell autoantigen 1 isoform X2 [Synchiropus splendidus]|uniref:islet cell autoantigen 1 isoform X2 n=1 Tax=Synchiropus splendidus TaxID=270530 RepID=UPI00237EDE50|nr:islet cell autoantigen 1 isoform X2 [Synchiropus splendidus]
MMDDIKFLCSQASRTMEDQSFGSSRDHLDRFIQSQDSSVVNKFQQRYWKTKQKLLKVTGTKQDEHVVASDADLDAKLEVFHSVQRSCMELLKVIEQYQRRICFLSQEENELGRFLRTQGSLDKTRAGKIMQATGKALCFSSQQRLALRAPLCRLYQEVETFRYRAISDTWLTVNRMEQSRTEYRGALLWMKDISQELDPDTHKQMEKFRKVQAEVRSTKSSFDKLKNDVCQKVDLLGASRCNLLSHVLTSYQTTLLYSWEKTSHTMAAIHESFRAAPHHRTASHDAHSGAQDQDKHVRRKKPRKKPRPQAGESPDQPLVSLEDSGLRDGSQVSGSLSGPGDAEQQQEDLLKEILGGLSPEDDLFSQWTLGEDTETRDSFFLPSQLLDQSLGQLEVPPPAGSSLVPEPVAVAPESSSGPDQQKHQVKASRDLSAWFNLFADLDPLANPDALGRTDSELHNA